MKGVFAMDNVFETNKTLVRRIYDEMWNQANPSAAREIFTSPEGMEKYVTEFLAAFPDLQHTVVEMIAEGDRVAARFSVHGTHSGTWRQFTPTGKAIHYTGVTLARIAEGKIVEHHTWWDRKELEEQIG
jgi:steroid delta-isomerase-like uncharacterized protein